MARIAGLELNDGWRVEFALTRVKGIGWSLAGKIIDTLKIDRSKRMKDLTPEEVSKITTELEKYDTEGDLFRKVKANIVRLQTIGSYRGLRHSRNLPVRGQRTRVNARTKRGKRKTIGAFKKEVLSDKKVAETTESKK
ncbi:MAG: 30S ribosomal protein S13 [Patescibacteria group bacterium]